MEARERQTGIDTRQGTLHPRGQPFNGPRRADNPAGLKPDVKQFEIPAAHLRGGDVHGFLGTERKVVVVKAGNHRHVPYDSDNDLVLVQVATYRILSVKCLEHKALVHNRYGLGICPI